MYAPEIRLRQGQFWWVEDGAIDFPESPHRDLHTSRWDFSIVRRSGGQTPRHNDFVDDLDEHDRDDNEELQRRDRESDDEYGHNDRKEDRQEKSSENPSHHSNGTRPVGWGPAIAAHTTATTLITAKTIVRCPRGGALSDGHAPPRS